MVDQNSQFYAILTKVGAAKQANADALGIPWKITHMAVGDANLTDPMPDASWTSLINEWRRAPLNQLKVDDKDSAIIIAEQVIPAEVGGRWIREIALFDEDGAMVAVANCAPTYKPLLSQGSGRTQVVRMNLVVSSSSNVQLKIDPSVVLATREFLTEELAKQDFKHSVLVGTTGPIVLSGLQTIDAVVLPAGSAVLVKDQAAAKENGIYVVAAGAWTRRADADTSAKVTPGLLVHVETGAINGDGVWQLVTDGPINLGVSALAFEMAFGRTGVAAGTYRSVTVDKYGRVVAATNPTTVAGYGLTDVYTKTQIDTALALKAATVDVVRNKTDGTVDVGVDWNTIVSAGRHAKLAPGDSPSGPGSAGSYFYPEVMYHSGQAFTQLAYPYATSFEGADSICFRSRYNATWHPWRALQHSGHYASKTEAEEGTASKRLMSPLAVSQAIASHAPPGFISGLSLAVNATTPNTDIDIEAGRARDSTDTVDLILAAPMTKRLQASGAWSAGAGGNALFAGAKAANTWYHAFMIRKDGDGSIDFGLDTSLVAANRPAGYSKFVRLKGRAVKTDASGNIIPFINIGNSMEWKTLQRDMQLTNATPGSTTVTISVPPGVRSRARVYAAIAGEVPVIYVRSPEANAATIAGPQGAAFAGGIGLNNDGIVGENLAGYCEVLTNPSAQVVVQAYAYPGYLVLFASLHTSGWTEV